MGKRERETKKKLCHSKIDSLLLPDCLCVQRESALRGFRASGEKKDTRGERESEKKRTDQETLAGRTGRDGDRRGRRWTGERESESASGKQTTSLSPETDH